MFSALQSSSMLPAIPMLLTIRLPVELVYHTEIASALSPSGTWETVEDTYSIFSLICWMDSLRSKKAA